MKHVAYEEESCGGRGGNVHLDLTLYKNIQSRGGRRKGTRSVQVPRREYNRCVGVCFAASACD